MHSLRIDENLSLVCRYTEVISLRFPTMGLCPLHLALALYSLRLLVIAFHTHAPPSSEKIGAKAVTRANKRISVDSTLLPKHQPGCREHEWGNSTAASLSVQLSAQRDESHAPTVSFCALCQCSDTSSKYVTIRHQSPTISDKTLEATTATRLPNRDFAKRIQVCCNVGCGSMSDQAELHFRSILELDSPL